MGFYADLDNVDPKSTGIDTDFLKKYWFQTSSIND